MKNNCVVQHNIKCAIKIIQPNIQSKRYVQVRSMESIKTTHVPSILGKSKRL